MKQGFTNVNEADYQRSITIPNVGVPQVTKIEFGAINCEASMYIDSTLVGTNNTCFTPSEFDITNYITPGQTYTLRVHVKGFNKFNTGIGGLSVVPGAATWSPYRAQGIYRSAFIKVYQKAYISDAFVITDELNIRGGDGGRKAISIKKRT